MVFNAVSLNKSSILALDSFREKICPSRINEINASSGTDQLSKDGDACSNLAFPERLPNLEEVGYQVVSEAMRRAKGNQTLAASMLGITCQGLAKRLKKLEAKGLEAPL